MMRYAIQSANKNIRTTAHAHSGAYFGAQDYCAALILFGIVHICIALYLLVHFIFVISHIDPSKISVNYRT